ncbi:hypothetical protein [Solilutibacter pythonis]|uniref:hypothetical protein n=1 Tax=Solilutibacter pythonis TaxID=2483112 RepID=UPI001FE8C753|nr:hypothetical protein [Lysobacter pythonis]
MPAEAISGESEPITGGLAPGSITKSASPVAILAPTLTVIGPVAAPAGTVATRRVALAL